MPVGGIGWLGRFRDTGGFPTSATRSSRLSWGDQSAVLGAPAPGVPTVYDQSQLGSCTANALAVAMELDHAKPLTICRIGRGKPTTHQQRRSTQ